MSFPTNPNNGDKYTNLLGTVYEFSSINSKWFIVAQGLSGLTGPQGVTGLKGDIGSQGVTGLIGDTGVKGTTGVKGVTGVQGYQGLTGIQGLTGLQGTTGLIGITGLIGSTGFQFAEYANTAMLDAAKAIDLNAAIKQYLPVSGANSQNYLIYFTGGATGASYTIRIGYNVAKAPGITGCSWPNGVRPALSGATAATDIITVYFNGTSYFAQAGLAFSAA